MSKKTGQSISLPLSISQNFLTSSKTITRLLTVSSICKDDYVLEIGCGKGHITRELIKVCRRVDAYEIDSKFYEQTQIKLSNCKNLNIKNQDFLKADLPKNEPYKVFSNIPFSITSDIVRKLTSCANPPLDAWLVMEKGAAKRFMGKPHETLASLSVKPYFETKIEYYFSREDFHPMPSVDIVLFHFSRKPSPDMTASRQKDFVKFVEQSLRYGVRRLLTRKQISTALKLAGLPSIGESGEMLYVQWLCLFRCYCRFHGSK